MGGLGMLRNRRGIVGVEAAIVLIAFIIIAAALSYVVINMGFYTTQKTKETMQTGLEESTAALQLDGVVTAKTDANNKIQYLIIP
ncbi:MAG: archaellin/type IV pilin N-terminal domain-containing protein, partial [Candidatus Bathyarchaeia archaeon]